MAQHRITASALLSAPVRQVYATIADFLGTVEGWLATRLLRPVYLKELRQLEAVAATRA